MQANCGNTFILKLFILFDPQESLIFLALSTFSILSASE